MELLPGVIGAAEQASERVWMELPNTPLRAVAAAKEWLKHELVAKEMQREIERQPEIEP